VTGQDPGRPQRTADVVHRAGSGFSHQVLPRWMHGQITVPIPTDALTAATGVGSTTSLAMKAPR
jgi:hypothetical protein